MTRIVSHSAAALAALFLSAVTISSIVHVPAAHALTFAPSLA